MHRTLGRSSLFISLFVVAQSCLATTYQVRLKDISPSYFHNRIFKTAYTYKKINEKRKSAKPIPSTHNPCATNDLFNVTLPFGEYLYCLSPLSGKVEPCAILGYLSDHEIRERAIYYGVNLPREFQEENTHIVRLIHDAYLMKLAPNATANKYLPDYDEIMLFLCGSLICPYSAMEGVGCELPKPDDN